MENAIKMALDAGFFHVNVLDAATIELKEEVRQMCAACHQYNKRWSCPPGCGTLDECRVRLGRFRKGILVQTVGELEDEFDGEGMMETEKTHKEHFRALRQELEAVYPGLLALGAGCCAVCKECAYPNGPCRFPEKVVSSMEAYGMVVTEVCRANGMAYNHGKNTIAYTSCFLLK